MYDNKRPRLNEALTKIKMFIQQGYVEAIEALELYDEIKEKSGEFAAGRYIIELAITIDNEIQELRNAKG